MTENVAFEFRDTAFNRRLLTFAIVNREHIDIKDFLNEACEYYENEVRSVLDIHMNVKVYACFIATFEKLVPNSNGSTADGDAEDGDDNNDGNQSTLAVDKQELHVGSDNFVIERDTNLREIFEENVSAVILNKVDEKIMRGSGFKLSKIDELEVCINRYDPLNGSSYIKTPKYLADKKAIINVKNNDDKCFMWAILSALHNHEINRNPQRVCQYKRYQNELNFSGIDFPMQVKHIDKFEKFNETISINVYMFDLKTEKVHPLRITKSVKANHIHLMLLAEKLASKEGNTNQHYCWIKDLSRLLSSQISKHEHKTYFCDRCLNYFWSQDKLDKHSIYCVNQNEYQIEMPTEEAAFIQFKNYKNQVISPFVIYADVEALLKTPSEQFCKSSSSSTKAVQQHEVYSVGYYLKCSYDDSLSVYKAMRGSDCLDWFVNELQRISYQLTDIFDNIMPLRMSNEDEENFLRASKCHICEKTLIRYAEVIVRDHCHFTGKFRGAAHQNCNLQYRDYRTVPVVFHNLSHYDSHFIIEKIANGFDGSVVIIPTNSEKYISFTKTVPSNTSAYKDHVKLKFIDSLRFMAASLDHLASLVPSEKKTLLRNEFKNVSEEQLRLLERKGVFCYDYVDSWRKLEETALPPKESFFSKLTNESISDEQYAFANEIWNKFNIKSLGEYSDLYMRVDVCLLAIVFENLRDTCYRLYKLDPANYFTAPGLAFDAMLKYTKVKLQLLIDVDMALFVERGIRGGISQCSRRYVKANNKYMTTFDETEKSSFIMYVDCNNLYGYAMMQHLPIGGFQWVENQQFSAEDIINMDDDASIGYYFEVDLEYPENLHDQHNDYPFCAENMVPPGKKNIKKLLLTLFDKKNYVIHYRMLKLALQHGLILKNIHRVLKFKQSTWLKPYIELNSSMRAKATNNFEKDFYKLMNNAVFGKTMENIRKRTEIHLRSKWDGRYGIRKLVAMPNFKRRAIFNENLAAIEMKKTNIFMNKPISVGMAILDISKVVMYDYYYNFLKKKYGDKINLLYTDTDSFILHVESDDFYADMKDDLERYDTSDYPEDNIFQLPRCNKKIPGLFKDELNGIIIAHFAGLRPKMYCICTDCVGKNEKKTAKGVKKSVLKNEIGFKDYMDCLTLKNHTVTKNQRTFRTKLHQMYTIEQSKVALSAQDDKRHIITCQDCETGSCATCNFRTLAHGHYKLKRQASTDSANNDQPENKHPRLTEVNVI